MFDLHLWSAFGLASACFSLAPLSTRFSLPLEQLCLVQLLYSPTPYLEGSDVGLVSLVFELGLPVSRGLWSFVRSFQSFGVASVGFRLRSRA